MDETLEAVIGLRDWLEEKLPSMTAPAWIDLEDYAWYLKNVRLLPYSVEDVRRIGAREPDRDAHVAVHVEGLANVHFLLPQ